MSEYREFDVIVASTQRGGIGLNNDLPWQRQLQGDLNRFHQLTSACPATNNINAVIMGRKTWESIPSHLRPLKGRLNIIVSRVHAESLKKEVAELQNIFIASSLADALARLATSPTVSSIFVIGGALLIKEALYHSSLRTVHVTQVLTDLKSDTFIPIIGSIQALTLSEVGPVTTENSIPYQFLTYSRKRNPEEQQYLDLVSRILSSGNAKGDRTGTGTLSLFGAQMRFDLAKGFPLLTTKRVFWRGVVEELLWLIRGCTDSRELAAKKIHIWDDNGSRAYLDQHGFQYREEGDLGPIYGHQWRHFGTKYVNSKTSYTGQGVDQLASIIHTLKTNPNDRRMVMSAWNPLDLDEMALPPCHILSQFYVANGKLSCQMYQRSCDMGLGVPFNIASYSLLTIMVAHVVGLEVGEFVHVLGDAHIYNNHVEGLTEQLTREPRPFPKVRVTRRVDTIEDFKFENFELTGYDPHESIKMRMAL